MAEAGDTHTPRIASKSDALLNEDGADAAPRRGTSISDVATMPAGSARQGNEVSTKLPIVRRKNDIMDSSRSLSLPSAALALARVAAEERKWWANCTKVSDMAFKKPGLKLIKMQHVKY